MVLGAVFSFGFRDRVLLFLVGSGIYFLNAYVGFRV
jgi:hypothetical protein